MGDQPKPQWVVGSELFDYFVPLLCGRCARSSKAIILGRAAVGDGEAKFQRRVSARGAKAILGNPEFHRTADGRLSLHHNYEFIVPNGLGLEFNCPECDSAPVPNAYELALVVGDAVANGGGREPGWTVPVLIDPFGGAIVGSA
jgi:hypothetical protein